jgi:hypothetical protein
VGKPIALDDQLYKELEKVAASTGVGGVERMIETINEEERMTRDEAARRIKEVYAYMKAKYGRVENSVNLLREDRAR